MSRRIAVLFRFGTILISISLALFLVSLIPASQGYQSTTTSTLLAQTWATPYTTNLSPQLGLHINVRGTGAFKVYLLDISADTIYQWIFDQIARNLTGYDVGNITHLDEFLTAHPTVIAKQDQNQNHGIEYTFVPTNVINATIVLANPSSESLTLSFEVGTIRPFGPSSIVPLSEVTFVIGVLLILPWLTNWLGSIRQRRQQPKGSQSSSPR